MNRHSLYRVVSAFFLLFWSIQALSGILETQLGPLSTDPHEVLNEDGQLVYRVGFDQNKSLHVRTICLESMGVGDDEPDSAFTKEDYFSDYNTQDFIQSYSNDYIPNLLCNSVFAGLGTNTSVTRDKGKLLASDQYFATVITFIVAAQAEGRNKNLKSNMRPLLQSVTLLSSSVQEYQSSDAVVMIFRLQKSGGLTETITTTLTGTENQRIKVAVIYNNKTYIFFIKRTESEEQHLALPERDRNDVIKRYRDEDDDEDEGGGCCRRSWFACLCPWSNRQSTSSSGSSEETPLLKDNSGDGSQAKEAVLMGLSQQTESFPGFFLHMAAKEMIPAMVNTVRKQDSEYRVYPDFNSQPLEFDTGYTQPALAY